MAVGAYSWLHNSSILHNALLLPVTFDASEGCFLQLGHYVTVPNNDAPEGDEPVDVLGTQLAYAMNLAQIEGTDLNYLVQLPLLLFKHVVVHGLVSTIVTIVSSSAPTYPIHVVHVQLTVHLRHD